MTAEIIATPETTEQPMPGTYVLAGGGTGGHLFPAMSVADKIINDGHNALIVTDNRGVTFFKHHNRTPSYVCTILRQHWLFGRLAYPFSLSLQILRCFIWLLKVRPKAVIGFGGYPSFPCVFAAQVLKIPTFLHEGNAFLGKANRLLSKKATKIALSFPSKDQADQDKMYLTGNPIRQGVCDLHDNVYSTPGKEDKIRLLVVGGSQGAKVFSNLLPAAIALLPKDLQKRLQVTQQCRQNLLDDTESAYKATFCKFELKTFLSPIEDYYKNAHIIIGRSGASTVAEVACAGVPILFVPFAGSIEGDQAHNAALLVEAQAAWMMREGSATPEKLSKFLITTFADMDSLQTMSQRIRAFAQPDAAHKVWKMVAENI